jgi:hypothetical protein
MIADAASQGVHIITPLADEFILILALWCASCLISFPQDYFADSKYCPYMDWFRAGIARVDTGAVHLMRNSLHEACLLENSFWRFYGDVWLRSIVTGTDSMVVLLASAFPVLCSDIAVVYIMIPLISCVYAVFFWFLHWFESRLPRTNCLRFLEMASQFINVVDLIEHLPPVTKSRSRVATHPLEWCLYFVRRLLRVPRYFYAHISSKLQACLFWSIAISLLIRLACIVFGVRALAPVSLVASLLAVNHFKFYKRMSLSNMRHIMLVMLMLSITGAVAASFYQKHLALFKNTGKSEELSERLFWHVVRGVLNVSREMAAKLLLGLSIAIALTIPCLPFVQTLSEKCKIHG